MIAIKKYIYITGLMAAILDFTRKKAFLKEDSGGILYVVLNSYTASSYVEKHLLTFLSIKYFGIYALKKCTFFPFFSSN